MKVTFMLNTKLISRSWWHFYTPTVNYQKEKVRKQSDLVLEQQQQNRVPRDKFNQGDNRPVLGKL